ASVKGGPLPAQRSAAQIKPSWSSSRAAASSRTSQAPSERAADRSPSQFMRRSSATVMPERGATASGAPQTNAESAAQLRSGAETAAQELPPRDRAPLSLAHDVLFGGRSRAARSIRIMTASTTSASARLCAIPGGLGRYALHAGGGGARATLFLAGGLPGLVRPPFRRAM